MRMTMTMYWLTSDGTCVDEDVGGGVERAAHLVHAALVVLRQLLQVLRRQRRVELEHLDAGHQPGHLFGVGAITSTIAIAHMSVMRRRLPCDHRCGRFDVDLNVVRRKRCDGFDWFGRCRWRWGCWFRLEVLGNDHMRRGQCWRDFGHRWWRVNIDWSV